MVGGSAQVLEIAGLAILGVEERGWPVLAGDGDELVAVEQVFQVFLAS